MESWLRLGIFVVEPVPKEAGALGGLRRPRPPHQHQAPHHHRHRHRPCHRLLLLPSPSQSQAAHPRRCRRWSPCSTWSGARGSGGRGGGRRVRGPGGGREARAAPSPSAIRRGSSEGRQRQTGTQTGMCEMMGSRRADCVVTDLLCSTAPTSLITWTAYDMSTPLPTLDTSPPFGTY